jgi:hypothetical protein
MLRFGFLFNCSLVLACACSPIHAASKAVINEVSTGEYGFSKLLVIQRHQLNPTHVYTYHQENLKPGGGLYVADFTQGKVNLTKLVDSSAGVILDASVHYDGETILFSWKREMDAFFQLYTIKSNGSQLKQLASHASNNFNACWLPDGGLVFLSDRKPAFAYCWHTTTPILWRCAADGTQATRISANYLNDFTPAVLRTGRIIYSRWEYVDRPAIPIQSLWSINPDGTMLQGVFGNRALSPATFMDAKEIPGSNGKILCILTAHNGPCRGAVGLVDPSLGANTQAAIKNLTPEVKIGKTDQGNGNNVRGPYLNPWPLSKTHYLVSKAGVIQLRDYKNELTETLLSKQDDMGFYSPQPVQTRIPEALVASNLDPAQRSDTQTEWATVMMHDVYRGLEGKVARGSIKQIAVVQEIEKPLSINPDQRAFGFQFPVVSCGATYAPKRIWGYARVEADGSANFKVPARQPIYFLPLDEKGQAVQRMRTFTHLMPGEVQSCVGCHADRTSLTPVSATAARRPLAMLRPVETLEEPGWGNYGFSYPHIVQPIIDKHCGECHGHEDPPAQLELTGAKTDFFNVSYENLVRKGTPSEQWWPGGFGWPFKYSKYTSWIPTYNGQEANILEVAPGRWGAKASLLAQIIDTNHPDPDGHPRIKLSQEEKRRIYAWMDLNCPYYGTSDSQNRELRGCRQMLPADFVPMMQDIGKRRCVSCHENADTDVNWVFSLPGNFFIRIDHPDRNNFLRAPLAEAAGGTAKCAEAVFKDTDDPDYQEIIQSFRQLQEKFQQRPRIDMISSLDQACVPVESVY